MPTEYYVLTSEAAVQRRRRGPFESAERAAQEGFDAAPYPPALNAERVTLNEAEAIERRGDPRTLAVAEAMPVALVRPMDVVPAEAGAPDAVAEAKAAGRAWGVAALGAPASPFNGEGVVVAVLDSGINLAHPAFPKDKIDIVPRNFTGTGDETDVTDNSGHGTHCAGTIFGQETDGVRIGVAPGVKKALIGKVLDGAGAGSTASVLSALNWAFQKGANIISMSLGFNFRAMAKRLEDEGLPEDFATSRVLQAYRDNMRAFAALVAMVGQRGQPASGAIVIAASGNDSHRELDPDYVIDVAMPAATLDVISVGALMRNGAGYAIAPFSNANPMLCAPGHTIVSANKDGGLIAKSGTSMACPHVAGAAALWWRQTVEVDGPPTADAVAAKLRGRVIPLPLLRRSDRGAGMARAPKADE